MNDVRTAAECMLRIRAFEERLDRLFEQGLVSGTYHRCIGQEATAVGVTWALDRSTDWVVSNHRNHGHYLAFTGDYAGLLSELTGREAGVSGGRGGSQVLFGERFISNGILGSTVPIATGLALGLKRRNEGGVVTCFIGDGALCEGVVYEAFNMAALWRLPILYVVEHNRVAQSTPTEAILAGSIPGRFTAFGIPVEHRCSTDVREISDLAARLRETVAGGAGPRALVIEAARLCAHSKGDDTRTDDELAPARAVDPLRVVAAHVPELARMREEAGAFVESLVAEVAA